MASNFDTILRNGYATTSLNDFWQLPLGGTPDPSVPNMALDIPATTIQFVGSTSLGINSTSAQTLDLTTLIGGIDTTVRAGDLVIFTHSQQTAAANALGTSTSGYTELIETVGTGAVANASLSINYKVMGATPDTTVVGNALPSGGRQMLIAYVFRNVDQTTPMDVTFTSVTGSNFTVDSPAITPVTLGAAVVAVFCTADTTATPVPLRDFSIL